MKFMNLKNLGEVIEQGNIWCKINQHKAVNNHIWNRAINDANSIWDETNMIVQYSIRNIIHDAISDKITNKIQKFTTSWRF